MRYNFSQMTTCERHNDSLIILVSCQMLANSKVNGKHGGLKCQSGWEGELYRAGVKTNPKNLVVVLPIQSPYGNVLHV